MPLSRFMQQFADAHTDTEKLQMAFVLLDEVCDEHADHESWQHNDCDITPCEFCEAVRLLQRAT